MGSDSNDQLEEEVREVMGLPHPAAVLITLRFVLPYPSHTDVRNWILAATLKRPTREKVSSLFIPSSHPLYPHLFPPTHLSCLVASCLSLGYVE